MGKFPSVGKPALIVWGTDMGKLTANEVKAALAKPGTYGDGDGLFLKVSRTGGASWLLRVQHDGKRRDNGAPGPRPRYHDRYFAAFVFDSDGNNIEAVIQ